MFFENQTHASLAVLSCFLQNMRHVIMSAYMQSGKTGGFHKVIQDMLTSPIFGIEHAVIFCGMNDTRLCGQAHMDCDMYNYVLRDRITIIYLQDLKNYAKKRNAVRLLSRSNLLIVTDECDRDSSKGSLYHKLLTTAQIPVNGDIDKLSERNIYMLNVSATPFAEHIDAEQERSFPKPRVKLHPGENYIGIRQFYDNGNMHSTFPIVFERRDELSDTSFASLVLSTGNKYNIIRYHPQTYDFELFERIANEHNFDIRVIRCNYRDHPEQQEYHLENINDILHTPPVRPTLILIHGTYRAGVVLHHKQHIGFVWENSHNIAVDTCVQGLPGRVCGYNSNLDIQIYVSPTMFERTPRTTNTTNMPYNEIERFICFHEGADAKRHYVRKFKYGKATRQTTCHFATPARRLNQDLITTFGLNQPAINVRSREFKRSVLEAVLTDLDKCLEWRWGLSLTEEQQVELEQTYYPDGDHIPMEERIDNHFGDFTLRHAIGTQHEGIIRGIQLSYRHQHSVRNNQGITDNGTRRIVVFAVEHDYQGTQDIHSQDTENRTWYYFLRTNSIDHEHPPDTTGKEMYRYELDEQFMMRFDSTDRSPSDSDIPTQSMGGVITMEIMRTVEQFQKYLEQMVGGYLHMSGILNNGLSFYNLRITRELKEDARLLRVIRAVESEYDVRIEMKCVGGRWRISDNTRLIKVLRIYA